jgi:hypothetical protein
MVSRMQDGGSWHPLQTSGEAKGEQAFFHAVAAFYAFLPGFRGPL